MLNTCNTILSNTFLYKFFNVGLEKDFAAWKKDFWRKSKKVKDDHTEATASKDVCGSGENCGGKCKCKEDGGKCSSDEEMEEGEVI